MAIESVRECDKLTDHPEGFSSAILCDVEVKLMVPMKSDVVTIQATRYSTIYREGKWAILDSTPISVEMITLTKERARIAVDMAGERRVFLWQETGIYKIKESEFRWWQICVDLEHVV